MKNESDYESTKRTFEEIQANSKFNLRLYVKNISDDEFEIKYEKTANDSIIVQMLAKFLSDEKLILALTREAIEDVIKGKSMDKTEKDEVTDLIKTKISELRKEDENYRNQSHNGLYLEVEELAESNGNGLGRMAVRLPANQGTFYALLIYQMSIDENFKFIMQRAMVKATAIVEPDTIEGKMSKLLDKLGDKAMNGSGIDDCECSNCVERRTMEADGKTNEEILAHFENKDKEEEEVSKGEANVKVAKDIIEGNHNPYEKD